MKKINNFWFRFSIWLLNSILLLLGFSSCDSEQPVAYGQPYATYSLKGKVVDAQKQPIPDIEVKIKIGRGGDYHSQIAPLKTNASGEFAFKENLTIDGKFRLVARDVDGTANGSFKSDSIEITMDKPSGGDGSWFQGSASKEDIVITLQKDEAKGVGFLYH
ncbi:radical SAM-associated putative lipoprotein [Candidatus Gracilibacteria bacterium]|nr:radical SAM-associated putative lipoprotein [Candidatus Gracilibacteria bacterium]